MTLRKNRALRQFLLRDELLCEACSRLLKVFFQEHTRKESFLFFRETYGKTLFFPRFFQKSVRGLGQSPIKSPRAAKRRCNFAGGEAPLQYSRGGEAPLQFRGQASENNKFHLPRNHARFRAINSSTKTQRKT